MLVIIGLATAGGVFLDGNLKIKFPVFTILFILISLIGIFYWLARSVSNDNNS